MLFRALVSISYGHLDLRTGAKFFLLVALLEEQHRFGHEKKEVSCPGIVMAEFGILHIGIYNSYSFHLHQHPGSSRKGKVHYKVCATGETEEGETRNLSELIFEWGANGQKLSAHLQVPVVKEVHHC